MVDLGLEIEKNFSTLCNISMDALRFRPPRYIKSIFGPMKSWIPPFHPDSEFRIVNPVKPRKTIDYLLDVSIPSLPASPFPIGLRALDRIFHDPTEIFTLPDPLNSYRSFPDESWFFINGIMTNEAVAKMNGKLICRLFGRPLTVIQNATDGMVLDLLECAVGKSWYQVTEPVLRALPVIYDAVKSKRRKVVVIAHSQGTIIASILLKQLAALGHSSTEFFSEYEPLTEDEFRKMEFYCFANCANNMKHVSGGYPYIESFGNQFDLVARLGMLAPRPEKWGIEVDGPRFIRTGAWGHLLNDHYLLPIPSGRKDHEADASPYEAMDPHIAKVPRLYGYLGGASEDFEHSMAD